MKQKLNIIKHLEREIETKKQAIAVIKSQRTSPAKLYRYEIDLKHTRLKLAITVINYYSAENHGPFKTKSKKIINNLKN
jgi:hypothetical protein